MTKDEIINKFILATGKEVDYWLLNSNRQARVNEIGEVAYQKVANRMSVLRAKVLELVLNLPGVYEQEEDSIRRGPHDMEDREGSGREATPGAGLRSDSGAPLVSQ